MSGFVTGLATVGTFAAPALSASGLMPAFIRQPRSIGAIIPDVTIEEQHTDRIAITQHPIADGTPVSDHAYLMPPQVTMRIGFTNANPVGAGVSGFMEGGLEGAGEGLLSTVMETRARDIYKKLRDLQQSFEPFQLTTGKRTYEHMMIAELSIRNDHTTEYALIVEVNMQQVFRVRTRTTQQPAQSDQAAPSKTASPTDEPPKQPDPKDRPTMLHEITGWKAPRQHVVAPRP